MNILTDRAGQFMLSSTGYNAFIPKMLPPNPPINIDDEMQTLLSAADRKLGRLDGITQVLPNPELFVAMYVKKEALLSSQIEGTQASLVDVINISSVEDSPKSEVREVVNYVNAMYWGLEELERFPLSLRLIRNIHAILMKDVRGANKSPGEFRTTQNWIGHAGSTLATATFVPPTVPEMDKALGDLEIFMHDENYIPALIKIALIHAQFETIHPFLDGNGRMGRLLITFWLCHQKILSQPLLYLSIYFKQYRIEYYDHLMDVRKKGDWENWIKFFLKGVASVSDEAIEAAKAIIRLKDQYSKTLFESEGNNIYCQKLLERLFEEPIITRKNVESILAVSNPTAGTIIDQFCNLGILTDHTPEKSRNKLYYFDTYLRILEKGTENYS